jgi:hypothetical protein
MTVGKGSVATIRQSKDIGISVSGWLKFSTYVKNPVIILYPPYYDKLPLASL